MECPRRTRPMMSRRKLSGGPLEPTSPGDPPQTPSRGFWWVSGKNRLNNWQIQQNFSYIYGCIYKLLSPFYRKPPAGDLRTISDGTSLLSQSDFKTLKKEYLFGIGCNYLGFSHQFVRSQWLGGCAQNSAYVWTNG